MVKVARGGERLEKRGLATDLLALGSNEGPDAALDLMSKERVRRST
jgi:hypothetical protein